MYYTDFVFYVYAFLRKDGTPYYIGKGKNKRRYCSQRVTRAPKDKSLIVLLESNLSELGAFAIERRMIRWWGRKNNGTGILRNKTDGGEGSVGRVCTPVSAETKAKMSAAGKIKIFTEEHCAKISKSNSGEHNANYGKAMPEEVKAKLREKALLRDYGPLSEEHKKKVGLSKIGKPRSEETKAKLRAANLGKKASEETRAKMSASRLAKSTKVSTHNTLILTE